LSDEDIDAQAAPRVGNVMNDHWTLVRRPAPMRVQSARAHGTSLAHAPAPPVDAGAKDESAPPHPTTKPSSKPTSTKAAGTGTIEKR
jgi:hypothetical protein